jgi:hypothetical protein
LNANRNKPVKWIEIWAFYGPSPPDICFVWEDVNGLFEVYSLHDKEVIFASDNYDDARIYVSGDEYSFVKRVDDEDVEVPVYGLAPRHTPVEILS